MITRLVWPFGLLQAITRGGLWQPFEERSLRWRCGQANLLDRVGAMASTPAARHAAVGTLCNQTVVFVICQCATGDCLEVLSVTDVDQTRMGKRRGILADALHFPHSRVAAQPDQLSISLPFADRYLLPHVSLPPWCPPASQVL